MSMMTMKVPAAEWRNWVESVCSNGNHQHFDEGTYRVCPDTKCWWPNTFDYGAA